MLITTRIQKMTMVFHSIDMGISLYPYQREAIDKLATGKILCGGVGSGKSRTSIAYYFLEQGCSLEDPSSAMPEHMQDLYIITTARKRDTLEWEGELVPFLLYGESYFGNNVVVDSWNNIKKYRKVHGAFFIFDEQRVVGSGVWVKSFLDIARKNDWILLSATPGDTWSDYIPVFVANGFYKNRTEFLREHAVYSSYTKYPKIEMYLGEGKLTKQARSILVKMNYRKETVPHNVNIITDFDKHIYREVMKERWNPYTKEPIVNASELCFTLRRICNSDSSRMDEVLKIIEERKRAIIFYNYNYELEMLREYPYGDDVSVAEWNGQKHEMLPETNKWVYLVQYAAGAEGWNCCTTDTIIFFSQNYSYKVMVQAAGRIDRMNTPYKDLYYYHLKTQSTIDLAIGLALKRKEKFNENNFERSKYCTT